VADLRTDRERAYWEHWRKSLRENPRDGLPAFLDELERIDEAHAAGTGNGTVIGRYPAAEPEAAAPARPAARRRTTPK
jgi:hypothetical protein